MEEGPEPHEWIEKSVEHEHHEHEHGHDDVAAKRAVTISAITAAVLAVCAALASLLSGHAANEAILEKTNAADHWSEFQANSTKGHMWDVGAAVAKAVTDTNGASISGGSLKSKLEKFEEESKKYSDKKEKVKIKAEEADHKSKHELEKHFRFSFGVAGFQVGIVLASISIMIRYRALWVCSLVCGGIGAVLVLLGLIH
jgi:hypothetical protein